MPEDVMRPSSTADVTRCLSDLSADSKAVVPWGGGTRMHIGNVPPRYDVALDLSLMNSNVEHVPGDMTVVCDAGVKLADVATLLAESDQRLPFDVAMSDRATIGGSVASNAPSRLAPRFGGIRDWVIGMSVVLADGTLTKSGGRVVKNVQGYDLHRLHTGAFGTLGVIVSVALKLVPVAERTQTVAMWFDRLGAAANAALGVDQSSLQIEAARFYSGSRAVGAIRELAAQRHMDADGPLSDSDYLMLVQVSGSGAALTRQINELTGLAGTVPANGYEVLSGASELDIWTYVDGIGEDAGVSLRIAAKPTATYDLVSKLERAADRFGGQTTSAVADVGYGSMHFNVSDLADQQSLGFVRQARETVQDAGGSVIVERSPIAVRREIDVFGIDASAAQIMKNMKQQFDANATLNPGRFAFRI